MSLLDEFRRHMLGQRDDPLDLKETEDPVVWIAAFLAEQAEEEEDIADSHAPVGEMRLCRTALAEQAAAVGQEHRVVMAQIVRPEPAPARPCRVVSQTQLAIARLRGSPCRDRQADRPAIDDRRRTAARRAVETLA